MEYIEVHVFQKYGLYRKPCLRLNPLLLVCHKKQNKKAKVGTKSNWCSKLYQSYGLNLLLGGEPRGCTPLFAHAKIHWLAPKIGAIVLPKILWSDFILRLSDEPRPIVCPKLQPKKREQFAPLIFLIRRNQKQMSNNVTEKSFFQRSPIRIFFLIF